MFYQDCLLTAVTTVLDWDIPDAAYTDAFNAQAGLMAGFEPEHARGCDVDWPVH